MSTKESEERTVEEEALENGVLQKQDRVLSPMKFCVIDTYMTAFTESSLTFVFTGREFLCIL